MNCRLIKNFSQTQNFFFFQLPKGIFQNYVMVRGWVGVENCWLLQLLLLRVGRSLGNYTFAITNHYVFLNRGKFHWRLSWFWKLVAFNHYYSLRGRGSVKMFEFCITLITGWVGSRKTTNFALRNFEISPYSFPFVWSELLCYKFIRKKTNK